MYLYFELVLLGLAVGAIGTLIGAGGGFVLVPVLLLLYPNESPQTITSISLAVVFFNALSGSWAYGRMGRIDYPSGFWLSAATVPGAILGAFATDAIPRRLFDVTFGVLLLAVSAYIVWKQMAKSGPRALPVPKEYIRRHVERDGTVHHFSYDLKLGMALSFFVGFLSSLLGIGGGIVHVPALVQLLHFPVHIATATSHFMLAIMAFAGTAVHIATGNFSHGIHRTVALAIGVVVGAQAGALFSNRLQGKWIMIALAIALVFVGIRILMLAL